MAATLSLVCRSCADNPAANCPRCRWLNVVARETEERIELLRAEATIIDEPDDPSPLGWIMLEQATNEAAAAAK